MLVALYRKCFDIFYLYTSHLYAADVEMPEFSPRHVTIRNDKDFTEEFRSLDFLGRQVTATFFCFTSKFSFLARDAFVERIVTLLKIFIHQTKYSR